MLFWDLSLLFSSPRVMSEGRSNTAGSVVLAVWKLSSQGALGGGSEVWCLGDLMSNNREMQRGCSLRPTSLWSFPEMRPPSVLTRQRV